MNTQNLNAGHNLRYSTKKQSSMNKKLAQKTKLYPITMCNSHS